MEYSKKVIIYAYTEFNFGDDMFIKILCDRYPNVEFVMYTYPEYKKLDLNKQNLKVYSCKNPFSRGFNLFTRVLLRKLNFVERYIVAKNVDCSVYICGSLFVQSEGTWEGYLDYTKDRRPKDTPLFLIGANFGPYKDDIFVTKHRELFETYTDVCFRDEYSANIFSDLKNVRHACDVVFTFDNKTPFEEKKQVALSVMDMSRKEDLKEYSLAYIKKLTDISNALIAEGYDVNLVSFCKHENDEAAVEQIYSCIENKNKAIKSLYRGKLNTVIKAFAESEYVIASRFHAMILAFVLKKPVLPIVYSQKTQHVIDDIGFDGLTVKVEDIESLDVNAVTKSVKEKRVFDATNQIADAQRQFEKLDEFLNK